MPEASQHMLKFFKIIPKCKIGFEKNKKERKKKNHVGFVMKKIGFSFKMCLPQRNYKFINEL